MHLFNQSNFQLSLHHTFRVLSNYGSAPSSRRQGIVSRISLGGCNGLVVGRASYGGVYYGRGASIGHGLGRYMKKGSRHGKGGPP